MIVCTLRLSTNSYLFITNSVPIVAYYVAIFSLILARPLVGTPRFLPYYYHGIVEYLQKNPLKDSHVVSTS